MRARWILALIVLVGLYGLYWLASCAPSFNVTLGASGIGPEYLILAMVLVSWGVMVGCAAWAWRLYFVQKRAGRALLALVFPPLLGPLLLLLGRIVAFGFF